MMIVWSAAASRGGVGKVATLKRQGVVKVDQT